MVHCYEDMKQDSRNLQRLCFSDTVCQQFRHTHIFFVSSVNNKYLKI